MPGVKKALGKYGPADVEDTTGAATDSKDDDDIDLFGSDDEEVLVTFLYFFYCFVQIMQVCRFSPRPSYLHF